MDNAWIRDPCCKRCVYYLELECNCRDAIIDYYANACTKFVHNPITDVDIKEMDDPKFREAFKVLWNCDKTMAEIVKEHVEKEEGQ